MDETAGAVEQSQGAEVSQPYGTLDYDSIVQMANAEGSDKLLNPNEAIKEASPATETETPAEGAPADKPKGEAKPAAKKVEAEFYEFTIDGKTFKVPAGAKGKVKIDGQDREVPVADALRHYQFDVPYQKKMDEVNAKQNKLDKDLADKEKDLTSRESYLKQQQEVLGSELVEAAKALGGKDVPKFVRRFAEMSGMSAAAVNSVLRSHFIQKAADYAAADEAQKKAMDLEEENSYLKEETETGKTKAELSRAYQENNAFAVSQMQQAGFSIEEWKAAEAIVIEKALQGKTPQPIHIANWTPHQLREYVSTVLVVAAAGKQNSRIAALIEKAAPALQEKDPTAYSKIVERAKRFGDLDDEALLEELKPLLGKHAKAESPKDDDEEEAVPASPSKEKPASDSERKKVRSDDDEDDEDPIATSLAVYN